METGTNWIADLAFVIEHASREELQVRDADLKTRHNRKGEPIGVQGRIMDAMDDGHIDVRQAFALLRRVQERLRGKSTGMSRVNEEGELVAMMDEVVEAKHGK